MKKHLVPTKWILIASLWVVSAAVVTAQSNSERGDQFFQTSCALAGVVGLKHCAAYAATKFAVEGLSLSVATEVEKFGIKITVVEPGFFRTDLLDAHNVRWVSKVIEDYAPEGTAKDMWSQYDGMQPGDPSKLGDGLVKIAAMPNPPKVFVAGGDALDVITPAIEERLREARAHETLSKSMAGSF